MNNHTAGPWESQTVTIAGDSLHDIKTGFGIYAGDDCICDLMNGEGWTDKEVEANAQLISAAPDLLEALQNALNVLAGLATGDLETINRDSNAIKQARAAIAKARG